MTITWETNVVEVVWESQTAPGITWTTVVGGTGGTEIPARRLLPNTVGTPGQTVVVNEAGTAVEYVDAAPRPVDVTFVLVEPGLAFDPTTDPVQMVGAAYLFQGTEPSGDPDEGWEPWEHTGLWQGTSTVSNPSSVMTRLPHELRSGDSFHSHAMINLKELVDPPAGRSYPPYGTDTTTSRIAFINSIVVGEEQVASVDNPKFILLDEQSQPGFVQGQWKPRVITEDDEVGWLDKVIYADTSGGDISLDAAQLDDEPDSFRHVGRLLVVKNTGSGVLTITNIGTVAPLGEGESAWLHVTESAVEVIAAVSAGGLVADAINDGTTTVAPSQNAVHDALATKADLASPALTGNPTAPTQTVGDNSTRIATTAFVAAAAALKMSTASAPLIRLPAPTRLSASGGMVGGLLVPVVGTSTHNIPVGYEFLGRCHHSGQTAVWLGFNVSANALTAGQSIIIAVYDNASDNGPGILLSSQSLVVGTTTGDLIFSSGVSLTFPVGACYVSVINPSTNAGTITIRSGTFYSPHFGVVQNGTWGGPMKRTGVTAPASDLSSILLRSSIGSNEINVDAGTTFPVLLGRTA